MQIAWSSPNPAGIYLFRELMMEFVDLLSSQSMLRLQTKPIPALTVPIDLKDFVEEEIKPVELMAPDDALKIIRSSSQHYQSLSPEKQALAEHVLFEEDDESGTGTFRVVCQLNKDAKATYAMDILSNAANGLDCTSFTIQKTKTKAVVKIVMRNGTPIELAMTIGLNAQKQRTLHGTYPESQASYGRNFWIRFAESLAAQGLLLGQTISISNGSTSRPSATASNSSSALPASSEAITDNSDPEYDSDDYVQSEGSVDSDAE